MDKTQKATRQDGNGAAHVVTVEPGIYVPNVAGVRIEDDILVTEDGYQVLTQYEK